MNNLYHESDLDNQPPPIKRNDLGIGIAWGLYITIILVFFTMAFLNAGWFGVVVFLPVAVIFLIPLYAWYFGEGN